MTIEQLIKHIQKNKANIDKLRDISFYFPDSNRNLISIEEWLSLFKEGKKIITIDARSELEFNNDSLPDSTNFPVLNNEERHLVGFLYKNVSKKAAFYLAQEFADKKMEKIKEFAKELQKADLPIFIYCFRGGKRSSALVHYLKKFNINAKKIIGGYKSYRNKVYSRFYIQPDNLRFVVLTGLTGCGKTKIIEDFNTIYPVFDIEKAASHASSLFGKIRYKNKLLPDIKTQTAFENKLFTQLIQPVKYPGYPYLTEGESKRINKFAIPKKLFEKLVKSPAIKISASIDTRVKRITKEYFTEEGATEVYKILETSNFLHKILGKKKKEYLLKLVETKRYEEFAEWFLTNYYDKRYAGKYQNIVAKVNADNIEHAKQHIKKILSIFNHN
jgi:tRNA 2-selenouridine synthase